ncbi:restriction endonuclease subunit S [Pseudomonas aeruginosa]|uniref:restriction endonuclease subunit S n=2 Tax=Pseudomonas aeruginosa TaxID=287 RepID=UPI001067C2D6|nr:restriction endonuclease subunit S [Pseudomonas aeruginosa]TEJ90043.1 restriction endonuclease subunit S [Pseudomonas aeruginosa]TEJ92797.1 restriction endonuclease subunit S [Pseudomonas aeruginosa]TEK04672.1 restriction endonuclease subunit S [Pseudomonas aeruginosa]TEK09314.1 restriction endonuclease subunit S [Pseudomonas aeruginosa]
MSWPLVQIGKYADKVRTWNPAAGEECIFQYVDLSSVDKSRKVIDLDNVAEISSAEAPSRARQLVEAGDVLVATVRPNLNGVAVVPAELNGATASTGYCVLRADEKNLHGRYLFHWVQTGSFVEDMMSKATGANYPAVSDKIVKESKIPLPPLPEQKRIAAILDKADAIRRKRQQAIQLADDFLRAVFLDMFGDPVTNPKGWDTCKFEALTSLVTYGLTVRPEYHEEGIPLISAREIRTGELDFESCPKISRSDFDALSEKGRPKKDDILFSKTGSIGHCAIVKSELDFAVTQNAARIVPNKEVCDPIFLLAFMRTNYFYDLANKEAKGNAVKDLQLGIMKDFPMYIPPISLQKKFVDVYSKASLLSEKVSGGSILLNSNFGALSQAAFSGQL